MAAINTVTLIGRVVRDIDERYAEDDAKATKATTNQAAKPVEDIDLDTPIDLSEIPF